MSYSVKHYGISTRGKTALRNGKIRFYLYSDGVAVFINKQKVYPKVFLSEGYEQNRQGSPTNSYQVHYMEIEGKLYANVGEWHHGTNGNLIHYVEPFDSAYPLDNPERRDIEKKYMVKHLGFTEDDFIKYNI